MDFYYLKQMKNMTMYDGNPYEYAVVTAECKKNIQLDRGDGEEHIYSFDSKDSDAKKNNRVVLVYIPHSSRIFKENLTVFEKIRS